MTRKLNQITSALHFRRTSVLLLFCLLAHLSFAQVKDPFQPLKDLSYFNAFQALDSINDKGGDINFTFMYWSAKSTLNSYLGQYEEAKNCMLHRDTILNMYREKVLIDLSKQENKFYSLDSIYRNHPILLFNEAHHVPRHRAFVYSQLKKLKDAGYYYLALEALNTGEYLDTLLTQRKYPQYMKTGFYINEPIFAQLIREALALGFELIPYESNNKNREEGQAKNIFSKYDKTKGGLVVLGGYGHTDKSERGQRMGFFLDKLCNEPVVSIRQFSLNEESHSGIIQPFMTKLNSDRYDYRIFFPETTYNKNIPSWFSLLGFSYKPLSEVYDKKLSSKTLVQMFYADEVEGIPLYQYLIEKENEPLLLPYKEKSAYKLVLTNPEVSDTVSISL